MTRVISICFGFTLLHYWLKKLASQSLSSSQNRSKTKTNHDSPMHVNFSCALHQLYVFAQEVLLSSLDCLHPLLLARVITCMLVLVLRYSVEKTILRSVCELCTYKFNVIFYSFTYYCFFFLIKYSIDLLFNFKINLYFTESPP